MSFPLHPLLLWSSQCQTGEPRPPVGTAWNVPGAAGKIPSCGSGSVAMVRSSWIPSAQQDGVIPSFPPCSSRDPSKNRAPHHALHILILLFHRETISASAAGYSRIWCLFPAWNALGRPEQFLGKKGLEGEVSFRHSNLQLLPAFHWEQLERIGKSPGNTDPQEGSACSVTARAIPCHSHMDATWRLLRGEMMNP